MNHPRKDDDEAIETKGDDRDELLDKSQRDLDDKMQSLRDKARSIQRRFSPPGGFPAVRLPSPSHPDRDR